MKGNRLFRQTRLKLASYCALVIGLIVFSSGYAIHMVMVNAFARTVDRELNTLAGTTHDALEAMLTEPGVIDDATLKMLPGICPRDRPCLPDKPNSQLTTLTKEQGYSLRLLNERGQVIATLGTIPSNIDQAILSKNQQTLGDHHSQDTADAQVDRQHQRYHVHTLQLHTNRGQNWGYLQVTQSFQKLDDYTRALRLILIFGVPIVMLLIGSGSWWISRLAMQPIYQSYEQMQQFTADAAHELRTPLAVARTAVENSLDTTIPRPEVANNLQIIQRQIGNLSSLAQDLLWLSRLDSRQLKLLPQLCCLQDLIGDLGDEMIPLAQARQIDLRISLPPAPPLYTLGENEQLYRAIANLIVNAIQYSPVAGVVTVALSSQENWATIAVGDNGMGIAAADLPKIFDRFYRAQVDRSHQTGGTGLGLSIVQAIVSAHQGTIQVQSQIDRGSIFTVQLPLKHQAARKR
jgi:signal transduction histidine kinase